MKYVYILGGVAVVAAAGFGGYFWQQITTSNTSIEVVAATAMVTPLAPDVSVKAPGSPTADPAQVVITEAASVSSGTLITTSAVGRAIVSNDDEIITSLDNNTEVMLELSDDGKETRVMLAAGATWSKVERALEQDEVYEVYTPTMVAAVRGTSFGISLDPTKSVVVSEGTVTVSPLATSGAPVTDNVVLVEAGNTLEIIDGIFSVRETTETDRDEWYIENNEVATTTVEMIEATPAPVVIPIEEQPEPVACTADVFQCPDGSFVSRTAPSCAFAACPVVEEPVQCTDEAKICPDGSTVERSGPSCEFAACPIVEEPETEPLKISLIDPREFYYEDENRIIIRGTGLDRVTEVLFNDESVFFEMSSQGVIGVRTSELEEEPDIYDVTLVTPDESVTVEDAVEVLEPEEVIEEVLLEIQSITSGFESEFEFVRVVGIGMDLVDMVTVDSVSAEFSLFSDTELHIFDVFLQEISSVTVSGGGLSDTATP